ncbi:MFS transporter [Burkholderiaceae bacterium FT117]|uniref:MFS transporter n=1 Tax=Zeimonas sediminis TaxID=2944268 RepID=UPI00234304E2|nr:MFS transporter [Zeimonas sediminis]MCM5569969.1 MFS transporter [Zeimonas sediminis]
MTPTRPRRILPAIALAQLAGASLWFATNGVMADLQRDWQLPAAALGWLTAAVQWGFVAGTLVFALLTVADRFSPRRVFLACALAGAAFNALTVFSPERIEPLLAIRFATGFFLAGIYPVGMKIASGWYERGLGGALGVLVGALVLGTALPHGLRAVGADWPWRDVVLSVSAIAVAGGFLLNAAVPDGPFLARSQRVEPRAVALIWRDPAIRAPAFGYFGHMWELYAFWTLVPAIVATRLAGAQMSLAAFLAIAAGFLGCAVGGLLANRYGSARVAIVQLATSTACCLAAPLMLRADGSVFAAWLAIWGITVVGDSPQFSALSAGAAPREFVGSVLTFINCIGFALTAVLIPVFAALAASWPLEWVLPILALGPLAGLAAMRPLLR